METAETLEEQQAKWDTIASANRRPALTREQALELIRQIPYDGVSIEELFSVYPPGQIAILLTNGTKLELGKGADVCFKIGLEYGYIYGLMMAFGITYGDEK